MGQLLYRSLNHSIIHYASRLLIKFNRDSLDDFHHHDGVGLARWGLEFKPDGVAWHLVVAIIKLLGKSHRALPNDAITINPDHLDVNTADVMSRNGSVLF